MEKGLKKTKKLLSLLLAASMTMSLLSVTAFAAEEGDGGDTGDTVTEDTHVHDYTGEVTTPATCTEAGEKTYTCACGDTYTETIPATGHTWGEGVETKAATCTEDGEMTYTCTVDGCGATKTEEIPTVAHTPDDSEPVVTAPTCTEAGYTTYTCSVCGNEYQSDVVEAAGHRWNDGEVTTPATCTEDGVMTYTCTNEGCTETKTEAIPATGHAWGDWVTGEAGTTRTCTACGAVQTIGADSVAYIASDESAVGYATLDAAIAAVQNSEVIELVSDAEITVGNIGYGKIVEIIGNDHTVTVPTQKTDSGALELNGTLTFRKAAVKFGTQTNKWSLTPGSNGVLNLLEGTDCSFEKVGIYASNGAQINVDASKLTLEDMQYTSMMGESYGYLNVKNGSTVTIQRPMNINGITGFRITVDASEFNVTDCANQGLVKCDLTLLNGATADLSRNYYGCNMYGGNTLTVTDGTKLTVNDCVSQAILTQGSAKTTILVEAGGALEVKGNGFGFNDAADESKYYASKGAISLGVFGWYASQNKVLTYKNDVLTFEDGANVQITDNYGRGITNFGTAYLGNGTVICNNGKLMEQDTEQIRPGAGGGVYNANTLTVADGAKIYNNHARVEADDIYNVEGKSLTLIPTGDWTLDDCSHPITGWFYDGYREVPSAEEGGAATVDSTRWNGVVGGVNCVDAARDPYMEEYTVTEAATTARLSLKAAHGQMQTLTVRYETASGETLADTETTVYVYGADYTTAAKAISNYTFSHVKTGDGFDAASGTMDADKTVVYVYTKNVDSETDTKDDGNDGGSGGGGGGTTVVIPDPQTPTTDIPATDVPTTDTPATEIPDGPAPLAEAPKTGDISALWLALTALSGSGLAGVTLLGRKRKDDAQ